MNLAMIQKLYDYNYWAHSRVWQCVTQLSTEQLHRSFAYSIGSIHAQLVHTMSAEYIWFSRLKGESPTGMYRPEDFPNLEAIRKQWDQIEDMVRQNIAALTEARLLERFEYRRTNGETQSESVLGILLHLINHGTDHRAQTLSLIDQVGGVTIEQDFIFYLRTLSV